MAEENHTQSDRLHKIEAAQLRERIVSLLEQVEALRETTKRKDSLEDLVVRLRDANQHLVIATVGAQGLQEAAEAANRRQEEFLSMLAHELRNPLAPIATAADLLGKIKDSNPQIPKLHAIISRQVKHMTRLVDDLLDASRFASGKIALEMRPLSVQEVIDNAVEVAQPVIRERNQKLSIILPATAMVINGDLVRLSQVFSNLLINAAKFTPEFECITISAYVSANEVVVSIKDHGMGIAADIQPFIFDLFTQGFRTLDRAQGGLGIGLSLVRAVVEMHGGNVVVYSAGAGLGSEFTVRLPVQVRAIPTPSPSTQNNAMPARTYRILLIEDNLDAIDTLQDLLLFEGHTIRSATNGQAGLAMAAAEKFDIVICDIGLPGMDGYAVARQLRHSHGAREPMLIALTGYSQMENRTRATEVGFDHYLVKPVASEVLLDTISKATCSGALP
jgi:two-component system CheB/CheR fusion protein